VVFGVEFGGFGGVVSGMVMVAIGGMSVVRREMMVTGFVVARGFAMVACRVLVVLGCFVMMLGCLLRHGCLLEERE